MFFHVSVILSIGESGRHPPRHTPSLADTHLDRPPSPQLQPLQQMVIHDKIFTVRNSSCKKVMFSQACVKNYVHGRSRDGVYLWVQGGVHPLGRHTCPWADTPSRDGHCSERYASYWNAFLFYINYAAGFQLHVSAGMFVQGGHTPIKAKKFLCFFNIFPGFFSASK